MTELFDNLPEQHKPCFHKCGECKHIEKWECGASFFFYCTVTKSEQTKNGLKKILRKTPACVMFDAEKRCDCCGKKIDKEKEGMQSIGLSTGDGKLSVIFCSASCWQKQMRKATREMKKMGREKLLKILGSKKG